MFFALWPPAEVALKLHAWARSAQRSCGGRVTAQGSIHLTLAFLGEIEAGWLAPLGAISLPAQRHTLTIDAAASWAGKRIVWAGPRETPRELGSLVAMLRGELEKIALPGAPRAVVPPFVPHLTLIRNALRRPLPPLPAIDWQVEEYLLLASEPGGSAGRCYRQLQRYPLRRGEAGGSLG